MIRAFYFYFLWEFFSRIKELWDPLASFEDVVDRIDKGAKTDKKSASIATEVQQDSAIRNQGALRSDLNEVARDLHDGNIRIESACADDTLDILRNTRTLALEAMDRLIESIDGNPEKDLLAAEIMDQVADNDRVPDPLAKKLRKAAGSVRSVNGPDGLQADLKKAKRLRRIYWAKTSFLGRLGLSFTKYIALPTALVQGGWHMRDVELSDPWTYISDAPVTFGKIVDAAKKQLGE